MLLFGAKSAKSHARQGLMVSAAAAGLSLALSQTLIGCGANNPINLEQDRQNAPIVNKESYELANAMESQFDSASFWAEMAKCWNYDVYDKEKNRNATAKCWDNVLSQEILNDAIEKTTSQKSIAVSGGSVDSDLVAAIQNDINAINSQGCTVGFIVIDLASGATISSNAWEFYNAASTIKASYVCALADAYPEKMENFRTAIENTISWSSNSDYLALRSSFGSGVMNAYMLESDVSSFAPESPWVYMRPVDQAKLWVNNCSVLNNAGSESAWFRSCFTDTKRSFINTSLGQKYQVYSKAGWLWDGFPNVWNDAGCVEKGSTPYVIVVMSTAKDNSAAELNDLVEHLDQAHTELISSIKVS